MNRLPRAPRQEGKRAESREILGKLRSLIQGGDCRLARAVIAGTDTGGRAPAARGDRLERGPSGRNAAGPAQRAARAPSGGIRGEEESLGGRLGLLHRRRARAPPGGDGEAGQRGHAAQLAGDRQGRRARRPERELGVHRRPRRARPPDRARQQHARRTPARAHPGSGRDLRPGGQRRHHRPPAQRRPPARSAPRRSSARGTPTCRGTSIPISPR